MPPPETPPEDASPSTPIDAPPDAPPGTPPKPTLSSISPDWGSSAGATRVTLRGTGFSVAGLKVTLGGATVTPTIVSDTELRIVTPSAAIAPADLTVKTDGGQTTPSKFRYLAPLYAADGRGGFADGKLYAVDPATGITTTVGALAFSLTGMAISPDGQLYGSTVGKGPIASQLSLVKIDPYTASGVVIGVLKTAGNVSSAPSDIAFSGNTLYGWKSKRLTQIDPATAIVTEFAETLAVKADGGGLAALNGAMYMSPTHGNGQLFNVNMATGVATAGPALHASASSVSALTFVGTTLYGAVGGNGFVTLYSFNQTTGASLEVGTFRNNGTEHPGIDAIAGIPPQP